MHSLQKRQMRRFRGTSESGVEEGQPFVDAVNIADIEAHADRGMLERSVEPSSAKMLETSSEARAVFGQLIDSSTDGIFAFDPDYRYTVWNAALERMLGLSRFETLGESVFDATPALTQDGGDACYRDALTGGTVAARDRSYVVPATGEHVFLEARFSPLRNDAGHIIGGLAVLRDVTERKRAEEELRRLKDKLAEEKLYLEEEIRSDRNFEEIIGKSAALRRVLKQVETVAPTDSTVLINGETGTGKELIARAIHNLSPRRSNAFVKLNCAAIPTGLLESELFGHEKGAFTGAITQRIGRFELAHRGTIFLDEIGETPLDLQTKLLRVLQEREFERLGSARTLRTDARLIASTNRDLAAAVQQEKFRCDLFYRLNVFPIHVPTLRERVEDIPLLVRHFAQHFARRLNRTIETISSETMEALIRYAWPGNIRELENLIERAVILSPGPVLRVSVEDVRPVLPGRDNGKPRTLKEAERAHILATVKETKWVLSGPRGAATRLGMNRSTLQFRMKKLGIVRPAA